MLDERSLERAAAAFREAALGQLTWEAAVDMFAAAVKTRTGQLIAVGRDALVPLNIMTNMPAEAAAEFDAVNGGDPTINSRVRLGMTSAELQFFDEKDFETDAERMRHPEFGAWFDRHQIGYTAISTLVRQPDSLIGLAALRDARQEAMSDREKRGFRVLAANIRSAVLLSMAVEKQNMRLLSAGFESLAVAAIVCDVQGNVSALTPAAEQILSDGRFARIVDRKLVPHRAAERSRFNSSTAQAVRARLRVDVVPPPPMALSAVDGGRLVLEFAPLSGELGFTFAAAFMIILRGGARPDLRTQIARELFGLTPAETDVAALLLNGKSPQEIAYERGVSVGTVRNHVHRILSKAGCTSQVEFLAALSRFT